jgi:hypothetical protein
MSYTRKSRYRGRGRRRGVGDDSDSSDPTGGVYASGTTSSTGLQTNEFGTVTNCDSGTVYNAYYQSCVSPCPSGQSYNSSGVCTSGGGGGGGSAPAASGGGSSWIGSLVGGLLGRSGATPLYPLSTGPSTTEILLLAGLGIGAVFLLTKD